MFVMLFQHAFVIIRSQAIQRFGRTESTVMQVRCVQSLYEYVSTIV